MRGNVGCASDNLAEVGSGSSRLLRCGEGVIDAGGQLLHRVVTGIGSDIVEPGFERIERRLDDCLVAVCRLLDLAHDEARIKHSPRVAHRVELLIVGKDRVDGGSDLVEVEEAR